VVIAITQLIFQIRFFSTAEFLFYFCYTKVLSYANTSTAFVSSYSLEAFYVSIIFTKRHFEEQLLQHWHLGSFVESDDVTPVSDPAAFSEDEKEECVLLQSSDLQLQPGQLSIADSIQ
jgi:hypothetical protein